MTIIWDYIFKLLNLAMESVQRNLNNCKIWLMSHITFYDYDCYNIIFFSAISACSILHFASLQIIKSVKYLAGFKAEHWSRQVELFLLANLIEEEFVLNLQSNGTDVEIPNKVEVKTVGRGGASRWQELHTQSDLIYATPNNRFMVFWVKVASPKWLFMLFCARTLPPDS